MMNACLESKVNVCAKPNGKNAGVSSCLDKFVEFVVTEEDLKSLQKANIKVKTENCRSSSGSICLSSDSQSLIGAGAHGLVVRGTSSTVPFGLAVKFLKASSKIDFVSFDVQGRYRRIELESLKKNLGKEKGLRESVALRLLTEFEISSVPRFVTEIETKTYRILAMELIENSDELSRNLEKFSAKELTGIFCQISSVVCNFDRISLGHDDLHERNILINRKNSQEITIIDFGGASFSGQLSSARNLLKQPINLLSNLKRFLKDLSIDRIQSAEKISPGKFCSQLEKSTLNKPDELDYDYRILFTKHCKFQQKKNTFFKTILNK